MVFFERFRLVPCFDIWYVSVFRKVMMLKYTRRVDTQTKNKLKTTGESWIRLYSDLCNGVFLPYKYILQVGTKFSKNTANYSFGRGNHLHIPEHIPRFRDSRLDHINDPCRVFVICHAVVENIVPFLPHSALRLIP